MKPEYEQLELDTRPALLKAITKVIVSLCVAWRKLSAMIKSEKRCGRSG